MKQAWLVWETEYSDEGSVEVRAESHWVAKRMYRKACGDEANNDPPPLSAARLTPEIRATRRVDDLRGLREMANRTETAESRRRR